MSAYIVEDDHINGLVTWAKLARVSYYWQGRRREIAGDESRIVSVLYAENVRSVNSRYSEHETAGGFVYRIPGEWALRISAVQILKACHCYACQACECADWETTEARAIVRAIEAAAIRAIPGYESADWGIGAPVNA